MSCSRTRAHGFLALLSMALASAAGAQTIAYGSQISLQSHHGRFLVAEIGGALAADRQDPLDWERFTLIDPDDPASNAPLHFGAKVALRSFHGTYVVAEADGRANADRTQIGSWETWVVADPSPSGSSGPLQARDVIALRSTHGKHLVAEPDGRANADRLQIGTWEIWRVGLEWTDFYYDRSAGCAPGECCACPYRGRFDGANCFVGRPPVTRQPQIDGGEFYYPAADRPCPLGALDGDRCRVGSNPVAPTPFLWDGGFYLASMCTSAGDLEAQIERVAHCSSSILCGHRLTRADFSPWPLNNVPEGIQRQTLLGVVFAPPRDEIRRVAFLFSGQQLELESGNRNLLTGQRSGFRAGWTVRQARRKFVLDDRSVAQRLLEEGILVPQSSLLAVAFDARFNHKFNPENKNRIETAYYEWLRDKFDPASVDLVYLAGHSRGGCFALRLAKRLQAEMPHLPIVAQSFDGVCNRNQGELGIFIPGRVKNPLTTDDSVFGWPTDLREQFEDPTTSLSILHLVGGHEFIDPGLAIRAFSQRNADQPELDLCWYRQEWLDEGHNYFAGPQIVQPALDHLRASIDRFAAGPPCPPVGECAKKALVPLPFECNDLVPADCGTQNECSPTTTCRRSSGSLTCNDLGSKAECERYDRWCRWRSGECRKKIWVVAPFECNDLSASDCGNHGECRLEQQCHKRAGTGVFTCADLFSREQCERYDRWCAWR